MATRRSGKHALLILDMLSEYDFTGWRKLLPGARSVAPVIARLADRARSARVRVVYVNDTRGVWESDQQAFLQRCLAPGAHGRDIVEMLRPRRGDEFIFKPRHSGFYATPLAEVLEKQGTQELTLTGVTSHQCVLFTAMDAYVRGFRLVVPRDAIAAPDRAQTKHALCILKHALRARTLAAARMCWPR